MSELPSKPVAAVSLAIPASVSIPHQLNPLLLVSAWDRATFDRPEMDSTLPGAPRPATQRQRECNIAQISATPRQQQRRSATQNSIPTGVYIYATHTRQTRCGIYDVEGKMLHPTPGGYARACIYEWGQRGAVASRWPKVKGRE